MAVKYILYILVGLLAGAYSGLIGLGGGTIVIPILIYFFGLTQMEAQGTSLALMLPPIGLLAAWTYWKRGAVNIPIAAFVCLGFLVGGLIGAKFAVNLPNEVLRKVFGFALLLISLQMIFFK